MHDGVCDGLIANFKIRVKNFAVLIAYARTRALHKHIRTLALKVYQRCVVHMVGTHSSAACHAPMVRLCLGHTKLMFGFWSTARMPFWKIEFIRTIVLLLLHSHIHRGHHLVIV